MHQLDSSPTPSSSSPLLGTLLELLDQLAIETERNTHGRGEPRQTVHAPIRLGISREQDIPKEPGDPASHSTSAGAYQPLYQGWATDLSRHGVGLLLECDLPTGTQLFVDLAALWRKPLWLPMRVVYCKRLLQHTHRVGGLFLLEPWPPHR